MQKYVYAGKELDVFSLATNWKQYFGQVLKPYLLARVLEVGAGQGCTTEILGRGNFESWTCCEPDESLKMKINEKIISGTLPPYCRTTGRMISEFHATDTFGTILYIDVLEHIKNDKEELGLASRHLSSGGYLVVLSPAYQYLFSNFDSAIGHFRRYDKSKILSITPPNLCIEKIVYLDSIGVLISLANMMFLRQSLPSKNQILLWDRWLIPVSKMMDWLLNYRVGRSIIAIWRKHEE